MFSKRFKQSETKIIFHTFKYQIDHFFSTMLMIYSWKIKMQKIYLQGHGQH